VVERLVGDVAGQRMLLVGIDEAADQQAEDLIERHMLAVGGREVEHPLLEVLVGPKAVVLRLQPGEQFVQERSLPHAAWTAGARRPGNIHGEETTVSTTASGKKKRIDEMERPWRNPGNNWPGSAHCHESVVPAV